MELPSSEREPDYIEHRGYSVEALRTMDGLTEFYNRLKGCNGKEPRELNLGEGVTVGRDYLVSGLVFRDSKKGNITLLLPEVKLKTGSDKIVDLLNERLSSYLSSIEQSKK